MEMHPIHALGIKAYCSDLVVDPEDVATVFFLSLGGYQTAVKGIIANLLEGYGLNIEVEGTERYLSRDQTGYKVQVKRLPSGLAHAVVLPRAALPHNNEDQSRFFIFTQGSEPVQGLFFKHLDEKTETPLHPSWADWLWKAFEEQDGWLTELCTLAGGFQGYAFSFNQAELHDVISQAIRQDVPEILACLTYQGGNSDGEFELTQQGGRDHGKA